MNKTLLTLLLILFITGVCVVSCPKHEDHSKTIIAKFNKVIDKEFSDNTNNDTEKAFALLASTICSGVSEYVIEKRLSVDNYFLFSVGKISLDGEEKIVSIGILNHVYTEIEDAIKDALQKYSEDNHNTEKVDIKKTQPKSNKSRTKKVHHKKQTKPSSEIVENSNSSSNNNDVDIYQDNEFIIDDNDEYEDNIESLKLEDDNERVYTAVEQMPQFPGGDAALMKCLSNNINYPQEAMEEGLEGRAIVQFVVKKDGSIGDVKIIRSVGTILDKEAIRLCKSLPKFTPGRMNGQAVNVWYTLPITFKISNSNKHKN